MRIARNFLALIVIGGLFVAGDLITHLYVLQRYHYIVGYAVGAVSIIMAIGLIERNYQ